MNKLLASFPLSKTHCFFSLVGGSLSWAYIADVDWQQIQHSIQLRTVVNIRGMTRTQNFRIRTSLAATRPLLISLANKTVVQLWPKSTTGSSILLEYIRYFCRRYDSSPPQKIFCFTFLCELIIICVRLCLILVWFCYINDFAGADTRTSLLYW